MALKNKVIVRIYGQEHTLRSNDSREYMQRVANLVDDKMKEIGSLNKKLSTSQIAVLTALNLTDEYLKVLDMFEDLKSKLDNPDYEAKRLQENLDISQEKLAEKSEEVDRIMTDYNKLRQSSSEYDNQIGKLRVQNDDLSFEINQKKSKLDEIETASKEKDTLINRTNMEKDSLKRKLKIYEGKTEESENELEERSVELSTKIEEVGLRDVEIFELKEELDELRASTKYSNEHILSLKKEIDIKGDEIKDVWDKYEITKKELSENELGERSVELSTKIEEVGLRDVEIFDLKEELDELRASTKFSNEHILALKKEIDIKGDEIKDVWDKYEITKKELNEFIETFDS